MKTTDAGYINKNNQKNLGCRGLSETHYNQKFFEMECLDCGHKYMANGCDIWQRKCPVCGVTNHSTDSKAANTNLQSNVTEPEVHTNMTEPEVHTIMTEPEVSLKVAMYYIQNNKTSEDVIVSIDGAHVKVNENTYFNVEEFLLENGYVKCHNNEKWQGAYRNINYSPCIIITSKSSIGDILINLNDGRSLYIESKKFRKQGGGEYTAIHEAIGQLMTGCPNDKIPVVAVPYTKKSFELANQWSNNTLMKEAGIRFALVQENGNIVFVGWK